jgi:hypothetical protein
MDRLRIALSMVRKRRFQYHEMEDAVVFSYNRKSYKIGIVLRTNLEGSGYVYITNTRTVAGKKRYFITIPIFE